MTLISPSKLLSGDLIVEGRLVDASNATLFARIIADGSEELSVVYKPIAGERPLWDFPNGNLASREVASYLISEAGRFKCVPTTVMRDGPFGLGAVQLWIDIDETIDFIELGQSREPSIRNIALFDVIVNNTDRKFGHILPISRTEVFGCDHGVTFHEEFKLRTVIWQFAGSPLDKQEKEKLDLVRDFISQSAELPELLTDIEIAAIIERIQTLESEGFPEPSDQWPAVPWPPV
jgi:uncharacterized repeat protein (TIGR03843 family)